MGFFRIEGLVSPFVAFIWRSLWAKLCADLPGFCALMGHICAPDSGDIEVSLLGVNYENRAELGGLD